jgi:hypothetical protein
MDEFNAAAPEGVGSTKPPVPPRFIFCCDVTDWPTDDIEIVDTLARLQLLCHRLGGSMQLRGLSPELRDLLRLTGLAAVLPIEGN